jgi:hypothetical protein
MLLQFDRWLRMVLSVPTTTQKLRELMEKFDEADESNPDHNPNPSPNPRTMR